MIFHSLLGPAASGGRSVFIFRGKPTFPPAAPQLPPAPIRTRRGTQVPKSRFHHNAWVPRVSKAGSRTKCGCPRSRLWASTSLTQQGIIGGESLFRAHSGSVFRPQARTTVLKGWGMPCYRGLPLLERIRFEWWSLRLFPRTLATEIRKFPRRIAAILGDEILRRGGHSAPWIGGGFASLYACNESILQLREMYPWATALDLELAAEAFRRGAELALGSSRSEETSTFPGRDRNPA